MKRPVFSFQKALDRGTATPCVARTMLQADRLMSGFLLPEEKKQDVLEVSHDVMLHQCSCLDVLEDVAPTIREGIAMIESGLDTQQGSGGVTLPSVLNLRKKVEAYLQSAKQSLRDTGRLFEVFHGQVFDHRFHKARAWAANEFGEGSDLARLLADDAEWLERVIDWRNAVEHPRDSRGPLSVQDFRVAGVDDFDEPLVTPPCIWQGDEDPIPLLEWLEITQDNLLTFFEDVLSALLLLVPHPLGPRIVEIPVEERDPAVPIRLQVVFDRLPGDLGSGPTAGRP